jgi:hypothetical protein
MILSPTQTDDLRDRCQALLDDMQSIVRRDPGADPGRLVHNLREILIRYGRPGIAHAVRYWFDAGTSTVRFSQVSAEHRWAAYALSARFAADEAAFCRLLEQVPNDNDATIYLMRAVEITAGMLLADMVPGPLKPGLYEVDNRPCRAG